jgi:hypothetical protein
MRRALLALAVCVACNNLPPNHGEVRGKVRAADGIEGATCHVEINATPPFLSPESVEVKTGGEFRHVMATSGTMERMYVAVRCKGYADEISESFSLRSGQRIDVGELVVERP